jgi:hypothetical protein
MVKNMNLIDELLNKIEVENLRANVLILSILTFGMSLTQNCYCTTDDCTPSFVPLIFGFFGIISGGISWLANPALFYALRHIDNTKKSTLLSLLAFFLAGFFLIYGKVVFNEAGGTTDVISYELGYWLWLISIAIVFFGNLLISRKLKIDNK